MSRSALRREQGATAVELALLAPFLFLLLGALVLLGLRSVYSAVGQYTAQTALRSVSVPASSGTRTVSTTPLCQQAAAALPDLVSVNTGSCTAGGDFTAQLCTPTCSGSAARVAPLGGSLEVREGQALELQVVWRVRALEGASDLALGFGRSLTTLRRSATGRAE